MPTPKRGPDWPRILLTTGLSWLGMIFAAGVFYASTSGTLSTHDRHLEAVDKRIDIVAASVEVAKVKAGEIGKTDLTEREKARDEFLKRADKTADGISELNKRLAVQETLQATMAATLNKISDQLGALALAPSQSRRGGT